MVARVEAVLSVLEIKTDKRPRRGWLWGNCPFHKDQAPYINWRIRVDTSHERYGQHWCFSCGNGGSLADLVSQVRGITLSGAFTWLDDFKEVVEVVQVEPPTIVVEHVDGYREGFVMPYEVIFEPLDKWVTPARDYVVQRGVTPRQIAHYGIGYAVEGRLAGRIVFPVLHPETGRPTSYMARDFSGSRRAKRYLWPDTSEQATDDVMFGEHLWPSPGFRETLVVTEGSFDALAVARVAAVQVGALGSASYAEKRASAIATFKHVVVLTDANPAGDKAAEDLRTMLARHTRVSRVRLPEGQDANSLQPADLAAALCPALTPIMS